MILKPEDRGVNIGRLKGFALESLPSNSWLRNVLLLENNRLTVTDFLAIASAHQTFIEKTLNNGKRVDVFLNVRAIEPHELDLIGDVEPLAEVGVEVL